MWYGVFLWTVVSSLVFHLPAALLALATLRRHKVARFFPIGILLMGIIGPLFGGVLTSMQFLFYNWSTYIWFNENAEKQSVRQSVLKIRFVCNVNKALCVFITGAAIAGVYKAAGKSMFSLEALVFGVGQSLCVFIISFLRILATL